MTTDDPSPRPGSIPEAAAPDEAPLRYRVLTGPDDRAFCERVSAALAEGYRLWGSPALTTVAGRVIVAQALVRDEEAG